MRKNMDSSDKTSHILPTSSFVPTTSSIRPISSTTAQKTSSRAKSSTTRSNSRVTASPINTSLNDTYNDAILAQCLSDFEKEEGDPYLKPRGKSYRLSKTKTNQEEKTEKELRCATFAQWVQVVELKKYLHFDRDIHTLSGKGKQYMDELWSDIQKNGLEHPLSLSVSKKQDVLSYLTGIIG